MLSMDTVQNLPNIKSMGFALYADIYLQIMPNELRFLNICDQSHCKHPACISDFSRLHSPGLHFVQILFRWLASAMHSLQLATQLTRLISVLCKTFVDNV